MITEPIRPTNLPEAKQIKHKASQASVVVNSLMAIERVVKQKLILHLIITLLSLNTVMKFHMLVKQFKCYLVAIFCETDKLKKHVRAIIKYDA